MKKFEKILFATDFSESSEYACDYAVSMAKKFDAPLLVVHVISEPVDLRGFYVPHISFDNLEKEIEEGAEKMMQRFCRTKLNDFDNFQCTILNGIPFEEIIRKAEEEKVSLIVMGTHGRSGIDHLLFGSTAERVVRKASCPVLTVRLPG
jgi:nucleotide-binding universal stress UspA family protein